MYFLNDNIYIDSFDHMQVFLNPLTLLNMLKWINNFEGQKLLIYFDRNYSNYQFVDVVALDKIAVVEQSKPSSWLDPA